MARFRVLTMAALAALLAIGVIGVPVAAANPKLVLVNGIPGRTVDVCVGNNEVRSGLKYGASAIRVIGPGFQTVRFRVASAGNCNGTTLAAYSRNFLINEDLTLVGTKKSPLKVVVYVNPPLGGNTVSFAFRNAGDLGDLNANVQLGVFIAPNALAPAFPKGSQYYFSAGISFWARITIWRANTPDPFRDATVQNVEGYRNEYIVVGTSLGNDKLVKIRRLAG